MLCLGSDRHQRPELCLFLKTIRGLYILIKFGFISLTVHSHTLSRKCFFFFFFLLKLQLSTGKFASFLNALMFPADEMFFRVAHLTISSLL